MALNRHPRAAGMEPDERKADQLTRAADELQWQSDQCRSHGLTALADSYQRNADRTRAQAERHR